jgi:hypothetical protein
LPPPIIEQMPEEEQKTAIELQFLPLLIISDIDAVMKRIFNDNH